MEQPLRDPPGLLESGTPAFRRLNLALLAAGFSTFAILYAVQLLLPVFSQKFHIGAAERSLSLSRRFVLGRVRLVVGAGLASALLILAPATSLRLATLPTAASGPE